MESLHAKGFTSAKYYCPSFAFEISPNSDGIADITLHMGFKLLPRTLRESYCFQEKTVVPFGIPLVEVMQGLQAGDTLITSGILQLQPGEAE